MPLFGHKGLPAWKKSLPEERPLKNIMSLVWSGYAVVLSLKALCVWGGGGGKVKICLSQLEAREAILFFP